MTTRLVALVGAGPGDPDLLTLRAEDLLAQADIVIVDAGLEDLVDRFGSGAQVLTATEGPPAPGVVLDAARRATGSVVRLYRGDPWLHPAYHGERAALEAAGQPFEAVAGGAVEVAVPALAGVAVHVRSLAVACTFGSAEALPAAWTPARTLVTSAGNPTVIARAVADASDPALPAALIPVAAPTERWQGLLGDVMEPAAALASSALLVVGAVCAASAGRPAEAGSPVLLSSADPRVAGP